MILSFLLSSLVSAIHVDEWDITMNLPTYCIVVISIIMFVVGEQFGKRYRLKLFLSPDKSFMIKKPLILSRWIIGLLCIYMSVTMVLYYRESIRLAYEVGYTSGLVFQYSRLARGLGNSVSGLVEWMYLVATCFSYLLMYHTEKNIFQYGMKPRKFVLEFIVISLYLVTTVFTTGRTEIMYFCIFTFLIYLTYSSHNYSKIKLTPKLMFIAILVLIGFFGAFYLLGRLTGKSQIMDFEETISVYVGGSIAALNEYCNEPIINRGEFGQHTLFSLYTFLNNFGLKLEILERPLEFVQTGTLYTNVYTALRRYIQDFGYVGCSLIMLVIGLFFGNLYRHFLAARSDWSIIICAMSAFVLIEMAIEERFFMTLITPGFFYRLIVMYIICRIFISKFSHNDNYLER